MRSLATPQWARLVSNVPDANAPPSIFPAAVAVPVLCLCLRSPETVSAELRAGNKYGQYLKGVSEDQLRCLLAKIASRSTAARVRRPHGSAGDARQP